MNYEQWEASVPEALKLDALWTVKAYRLGLFLSDLAWRDLDTLSSERRMRSLSDQLYRAVGSIGANLAEGYSRSTGHDRARFYEYALGSARESREWYYRARHVLGSMVVEHRISVLSEIIRLLLTMVSQQRRSRGRVQEVSGTYAEAEAPDQTLTSEPS